MPEIKVLSELPGRVSAIAAEVGVTVAEDDPVVMIESMKMEVPLTSPADGVVKAVLVAVDDTVTEGQQVAVVEG